MNENKKILLSIFFAIASAGLIYSSRSVFADNTITSAIKGRIVLQVEDHGEAWYINPADLRRYYMGRPTDAFNLMHKLSIGITNADLQKIPVGLIANNNTDTDGDGLPDDLEKALGTDPTKKDTDGDGYDDKTEILGGYNPLSTGLAKIDRSFARANAGKIFLQVEAGGAAWYVNPADNKRYFLSRPTDAFNVMRKLGLGIKSSELATVDAYYNPDPQNQVADQTNPQTATSSVYQNSSYKYSLTYPYGWNVRTFASAPMITQIGDAKLDYFTEHAGVISISYLKEDQPVADVGVFRIASKAPSQTLTDEAKNINGYSAYENSYQHKLAYEKTTTIKVSDKEFMVVSLTTTNDRKDYYEKIYNEIISSIKFGQ